MDFNDQVENFLENLDETKLEWDIAMRQLEEGVNPFEHIEGEV
jgi:hypothetical protein